MPTTVALQRPPDRGVLRPAAASSLAPGWLHGPPVPARVVAVFDRAAYLLRAGEVLPVLAPGALALPGGLRVADGSHLDELALRTGQDVEAGRGRILASGGGLVVRRTWRPQPVPSRALSVAARAGAGYALEPFVEPVRDLRPLAVLAASGTRTAAAGEGLVGLGPGLTPAGDDVLCGVLLGLRASGAESRCAALARAVGPLLGRTTALSATLLRQAARGYGVPPVVALVHAWHRDEAATDLAALASQVAAVGHTSGPALLLGLSAALAAPHTADPACPHPSPTPRPAAAAAGDLRGPS